MAERTINVELRVGQSVKVGSATVTLEEKSGQRARLRITAPAATGVEPPPKKSGAEAAQRGVL